MDIVIVIVISAVMSFLLGRATAPKPKNFGLDAAEALSGKLGGDSNQESARVARIAAAVTGMNFTVTEEAGTLADELEEQARLLQERAEQLRRQAAASEDEATSNTGRASEVTTIASLFKS